jgi:uncharacterized protein
MESARRVEIKEYETARLSRPNVILGVPEVGLVGTIATSYLIDKLELPEAGYVVSDMVPDVIVVHDSKPKVPIRIYGKDSLAIAVSEIPLTPRLSYELTMELVRWARVNQCRMIVGATGIPSRKRVEMADEQKPSVFALTNREEMYQVLTSAGASKFEEGILVGAYANMMRHAMLADQTAVVLMAEAYVQFPDPGAAVAAIEVLNRVISIDVDVKPLIEEAEEIRLRTRELMKRTEQAIQQQLAQQTRVYA